MDLKSTFGRRCKEARKARGWSMRQAAERMGCTAPFVAKIEAGKYNPTLEKVEEVAGVYRVKAKGLLT